MLSSHISKFTYDYFNGQLTSSKDPNNQVSSYIYNDFFARPTQVNSPDGGQTSVAYNDAAYSPTANTPSVTTTKKITSALNQVSITATDGVGHAVRTILSSDPDGADTTDTTYDGSGRALTQSNPYRSSSSPTDGTTTYTYDGLGRTISALKQDGSTVNTFYDQSSTNTTSLCTAVKDEAGMLRKSCSDGLGRLVEVDEPGTGAGTATPGTGSVTISGSEQTRTGSAGSGSIGISSGPANCIQPGLPYSQQWQPQSGSITVTINGATAGTNWGGNCNSSSETLQPSATQVAANLAAGINASAANVTATANGTTINLVAKTTGANTNYSVSVTESWGLSTGQGGQGYTACCSGTLTGGSSGGSDSGTVSVTVNGYAASQNYGSSDTAQTIASGLTTQLNSGSSPISASLSGTTITVTSRVTGAASNYSLSTSRTWNSQLFASPSFSGSPSGSALTGGSDATLGTAPLVTLYSYDTLNNLTCAVQKGTDTTAFSTCAAAPAAWRPRSFVYDSLSRLTSATNPESGNITYAYDANGNLSTKVQPKMNKIPADTSSPQTNTVSYFYDVENRLTKKSYSDNGATVQYAYDGNSLTTGCTYAVPTLSDTNPIHRRTAMCDASGATHWALDLTSGTGWKSTEARNINNVTKSIFTQTTLAACSRPLHIPAGGLSRTHPVVLHGRFPPLILPTAINYAQNATYAPFGGLLTMTNGAAPITVTNAYNERLQPVTLSAGTTANTIMSISYNFHRANGDNGKSFQIVNNRDNNRNQNFTYDALNRIASAATQATSGVTCWGETFTIDSWGNITDRAPVAGMSGCATESSPAPFTTTTSS